MSSVSLLVLPHQFIMRHYFVCFVISEAASLDHCYTVLIRLFLYELILMLDGPMIRTHATPPHSFVFFLGSSLISWHSKRQDVMSRSSTKAKYHAMADTTVELWWLRDLLCDIGVSVITHVFMHCDNKSDIAIAFRPVFHICTKNIEIDCHFARQEYEKGMITLPYVNSGAQLTDLFTKTQTLTQFHEILFKHSVFDPS